MILLRRPIAVLSPPACSSRLSISASLRHPAGIFLVSCFGFFLIQMYVCTPYNPYTAKVMPYSGCAVPRRPHVGYSSGWSATSSVGGWGGVVDLSAPSWGCENTVDTLRRSRLTFPVPPGTGI